MPASRGAWPTAPTHPSQHAARCQKVIVTLRSGFLLSAPLIFLDVAPHGVTESGIVDALVAAVRAEQRSNEISLQFEHVSAAHRFNRCLLPHRVSGLWRRGGARRHQGCEVAFDA
jgi:hypothetical protein